MVWQGVDSIEISKRYGLQFEVQHSKEAVYFQLHNEHNNAADVHQSFGLARSF